MVMMVKVQNTVLAEWNDSYNYVMKIQESFLHQRN